MFSMPKKDASPLSKTVSYLNGSLDHGTGERLLAGFEDDGSERLGVRTRSVPGL